MEPNLINCNKKECSIRTSQNEAVNRIKLNYTDKKTDYPKSTLAILHNNNGVEYLLKVAREAKKLWIKKKVLKADFSKVC